jgi:hypothetical protein
VGLTDDFYAPWEKEIQDFDDINEVLQNLFDRWLHRLAHGGPWLTESVPRPLRDGTSVTDWAIQCFFETLTAPPTFLRSTWPT